jgi:hypothetical protein
VSGKSSSDDGLETWRAALESRIDGFGRISGSRELRTDFGWSFGEDGSDEKPGGPHDWQQGAIDLQCSVRSKPLRS